MTEKNGKYYCDICKDETPIPKGEGFWFAQPNFGIEHAHQTCYRKSKNLAKRMLGLK